MKYPEEIIFNSDEFVMLDIGSVADLIEISKKNKRRRARICAHNSEEDKLHEMFIVHEKDTYVRPHKHINKTESFHLIHGKIRVIIFNDDGVIKKAIEMGEYRKGNPFFYRIGTDVYHTLQILSEFAVFHETTNGPFIRENTIWADWAPKENDLNEIEKFMSNLEHDR